jgi:rare lipoprotein A
MRSLLLAALLLAAACSTAPTTSTVPAPQPAPEPQRPGQGGYYKDDGPGERVPPDLASIPDAQPRVEPLSRFANRPYEALGTRYVPLASVQPFRERGLASWYGRRYHGRRTTSGEVYDMYAMTAAHPTLPIPSYARVTSLASGRSVVVRINDRGPFLRGRVIDLSYAAAYRLGLLQAGSGEVLVEAIVPGEADTVAASEPAAARGIFLQVGAFASRDNAESLRARLASFEEPGELLLTGNLWRLQLGPYRTQDEARTAAERLERTFDLKPLVVVR